MSVKYRLDIQTYDFEKKCTYCALGALDVLGDAVVVHGTGDAIAGNYRTRDWVAKACSTSNVSPVIKNKTSSLKVIPDLEPSFCHHGRQSVLLVLL